MQRVARWITNRLFFTGRTVDAYRHRHPDARVVAYGGTKARRFRAEQPVARSAAWVIARRGTLILTDRELSCGDWAIPIHAISKATLTLVGVVGAVLAVETADGEHYQFGLTRDPAWTEQIVVDLEVRTGRVGWSWSSALIWGVLIGLIVYLILA